MALPWPMMHMGKIADFAAASPEVKVKVERYAVLPLLCMYLYFES